MLDGLVGQTDVEVVLLVLQIEFALLGDIADREGDAIDLAIIFIDGVKAHLRVTVDTTLDDDTLRTEIEIFHMTVVQNITERGHVEEGIVVIIGVVLRLEFQYLTHLLIGGEQFTVLIVESKTSQ